MTRALNNPVVTLADLPVQPFSPHGDEHDKFGARISSITADSEEFGLGAMYVRVAPGKRAFPVHNHLANDEMFIVLEGEGTYRFGEDEHAVKAGDVCLAPKGGKEMAHQLINSGAEDLVYIGLSTMSDPDIVEYPDSGKFAAMSIWPGKSFFQAHLRHIGRREDTRDYWEGEL